MDLSHFDNNDYNPGAGFILRVAWYLCNAVVFDSWLVPISSLKRVLLRLFGARVGKGVVIKPRVNVKYPWQLIIGDHSWIGEGVWIDNLVLVKVGANVCISQGAYLLTGNHDYRDDSFRLLTAPIVIEDRSWVGASAVVCPGVTMRSGSVLTIRSVAHHDLDRDWIYQGAPAAKLRPRYMQSSRSSLATVRAPYV